MCYVGLKFRSQLLVHLNTVASHQGIGVSVNILVSVMRFWICCSVNAWFIKAITLQTLNDIWTLCLNESKYFMKSKLLNPGTFVPHRGMREMPKKISGGRNSTCKFTKDLFEEYKIVHCYSAFLILTSSIAYKNCLNRCYFRTELFNLPFSFLYIS